MEIRRIVKDDRDELLELLHQFHNVFHREKLLVESPIATLIQYLDPRKSIEETLEELYSEEFITFIAIENEVIVGFIGGKIISKEGKVFKSEGYVDELFVGEGQRNKGIGKKLFESLCKEFRKRGCTHLGVSAYAENATAINFYHKLGFKDFVLTLKKKIEKD